MVHKTILSTKEPHLKTSRLKTFYPKGKLSQRRGLANAEGFIGTVPKNIFSGWFLNQVGGRQHNGVLTKTVRENGVPQVPHYRPWTQITVLNPGLPGGW